jgi:hypothetical protein
VASDCSAGMVDTAMDIQVRRTAASLPRRSYSSRSFSNGCSLACVVVGYYAQPTVIVQQPAPTAVHMAAQPASSPAAHDAHHAHVPPAIPTYEERIRLYQHGYGLDPDVVFNLWEHQGANSWWGVPGPTCPTGTPVSVACAYGGVPSELTEVYTVEQWIALRQEVEQLHKRYQFHFCPLFCTVVCCVPCCLGSAFDNGMTVLFAAENQRLEEQGLWWDWDSDRDKMTVEDTRNSGYSGQLRLLCPLKVQPKARRAFEQLHPLRRRILGTPYGHILYASAGQQHDPVAASSRSAEPSTAPPALGTLSTHANMSAAASSDPVGETQT